MSIPSVNLDDRTFNQLVDEALQLARQAESGWEDLGPSDPGRILLELFAYLTDTMIYRINRLPEKVYVELLNLMNVQLEPPAAARAELLFSREQSEEAEFEIPAGTQISAAGESEDGTPLVFVTREPARVPSGKNTVLVTAYHCEEHHGELLGTGSGLAGLTLLVDNPPIVARCDDDRDLIVGVQLHERPDVEHYSMREYEGDHYRIWREVESFAEAEEDPFVFTCDRLSGSIQFAPAARTPQDESLPQRSAPLGAVPPAGMRIRAWYRSGGGVSGNVSRGSITNLLSPLPGAFKVTNPRPAFGGADPESVRNAMTRAPLEFNSLRRAVTASDFELHARRASRAVNRSYAFSKRQRWQFAEPGTVQVLLIPSVPPEKIHSEYVSQGALDEAADPAIVEIVRQDLNERSPLGTFCAVDFANLKTVTVKARVIVFREEEPEGVKRRILERLHRIINPLDRGTGREGWPFGQELSVFRLYQILNDESGVKNVEPPLLEVDKVPGREVSRIGPDAYQEKVWYSVAKGGVFRSVNDGDGWEQLGSFGDEQPKFILPYPTEASLHEERAGLVALITESTDDDASGVYVSRDCGETFQPALRPSFRIDDVAWYESDTGPSLLLATDDGLYRLDVLGRQAPVAIAIDPEHPGLGVYAIAISQDAWGKTSVAAAAHDRKGVYLSVDGARPGVFQSIGLDSKEVRSLAVQHDGRERYLWAGITVIGDGAGEGAWRWQLTETHEAPGGWRPMVAGWRGGSCRNLAFYGGKVLAGTDREGVLQKDIEQGTDWQVGGVNNGLPQADDGTRLPINALAVTNTAIMVGSPAGIYRSDDGGQHYVSCSQKQFTDRVTLPPAWVFCSGPHEIDVVSEDDA